jgi:hypothetical protein
MLSVRTLDDLQADDAVTVGSSRKSIPTPRASTG